jgi:hypothetical protein
MDLDLSDRQAAEVFHFGSFCFLIIGSLLLASNDQLSEGNQ